MPDQPIVSLAELPPGRTAKFQFVRDEVPREGFVANVGGVVVAYENACRHIPIPLDNDDNRFFTSGAAQFICQSHGATYEPLTGLCVRGPCEGASLKPLPIRVSDGVIHLAELD